jgi:hypothetical protein
MEETELGKRMARWRQKIRGLSDEAIFRQRKLQEVEPKTGFDSDSFQQDAASFAHLQEPGAR